MILFLFYIEIEGKGGWIIWGGGGAGSAKGYVGPLSQIIEWGLSSYAYVSTYEVCKIVKQKTNNVHVALVVFYLSPPFARILVYEDLGTIRFLKCIVISQGLFIKDRRVYGSHKYILSFNISNN